MANDNKKWLWIVIVGFILVTSMGAGDDKKTGFGCTNTVTPTVEDTSGVEIYFTDAPADDVQFLDTVIEKIELVSQTRTVSVLSAQTQLRLQEHLAQKVVGETIPKDDYREMRVYFKNVATAMMNAGESKQISVRNTMVTIPVNAVVGDDEILSFLVDIPLQASLKAEGDSFVFEPSQIMTQSQVRTQTRNQIREEVRTMLNERIQLGDGSATIDGIVNQFKSQNKYGNN